MIILGKFRGERHRRSQVFVNFFPFLMSLFINELATNGT